MTDYSNSKPTGFTPWGVTTYDYEPRSAVHHRPAPTATNRAAARGPGVDMSKLVDMLYRNDGKRCTFPGRQIEPIAVRSGKRTVLAIKRHPGNGNIYVEFRCKCGAVSHCQLHVWRNAAYDAGCIKCVRAVRDTAMRPAYPINPTTEHGRARRRFEALTTPPYQKRAR